MTVMVLVILILVLIGTRLLLLMFRTNSGVCHALMQQRYYYYSSIKEYNYLRLIESDHIILGNITGWIDRNLSINRFTISYNAAVIAMIVASDFSMLSGSLFHEIVIFFLVILNSTAVIALLPMAKWHRIISTFSQKYTSIN